MVGQFTDVYLRQGKWYAAYVEEIPGVNTQGRTLAEAGAVREEPISIAVE